MTASTLLPLVRVVVINFDGGQVTCECLDSLLATKYPADRLEIVVVDNASVDGLLWTLPQQYPTVRLIVSDVNEGFARGCNLAMTDLESVDYVALINNDARVDCNWLRPLIEAFDTPGIGGAPIGAVSPKLLLDTKVQFVSVQCDTTYTIDDGRSVGIEVRSLTVNEQTPENLRYNEGFWADQRAYQHDVGLRRSKQSAAAWWPVSAGSDDTVEMRISSAQPTNVTIRCGTSTQVVQVDTQIQTIRFNTGHETWDVINSAGGGLYDSWAGGDIGFMEPDVGQFDQSVEMFSWCGGAVLLSAKYLRQVGIFDPSYFLYYEDFDLSWRGRWQGWTYRFEPQSTVVHRHAYSSKEGSDFFQFWVDRNRRLTLVKNAPFRPAFRAVVGSIVALFSDLLRHTIAQARRLHPPSPRWLKKRFGQTGSLLRALPHAVAERRRIQHGHGSTNPDLQRWMLSK